MTRLLRLALLAIVATIPFAIEPIYQRISFSQTYYLNIAGLGVAMLAVAAILALGLPLRRPSAIFWAYLVYMVVVVLAVLIRPVPVYGLSEAILPLTGLGLLFVLEAIPSNRRWQEKALLLFVIVAFVSAVYGVLQNFGIELIGRAAPETERQVLVSFFGHSNYMASFIGPVIFLAAYFLELRRGPWLIVFAAATIVLIVVCMYWAGTRAAALACLLAAISLIRWRWPRFLRRKRFVIPVALGLVAVLAAAAVYGHRWGRHEETLVRRLTSHREIRNRIFYWLIGIEMIRDHPALGIGHGRYDTLFWPYTEEFVQRPGHGIYSYVLRAMNGTNPGEAHNDLLEVACESGLAGILAFLAIWVLVLLALQQCIRRGEGPDQRLARCLRAALIFIFVDSLFGFPLQLPASGLLFWFTLGFAAQTHRRLGTERVSQPLDEEKPAPAAVETAPV